MRKLEDQTTKDPLYEVLKERLLFHDRFARHDDSRGEADLENTESLSRSRSGRCRQNPRLLAKAIPDGC